VPGLLAPLLVAAALAGPLPPAHARPPAAPRPSLADLRLDAAAAALDLRWGRLAATAARLLERDPLDADAYRLAGDAAALAGRRDEAVRLLEKAQLLAGSDATAPLLAALPRPHGPPAADEAAPAASGDRVTALALLDLAGNPHLQLGPVACAAAARARALDPSEPRAGALLRALRCPAATEAR
jgi:tetratricopeptide (TPR) repeat protein